VLGSVLGGGVDMVSFGPTILGAHSPGEPPLAPACLRHQPQAVPRAPPSLQGALAVWRAPTAPHSPPQLLQPSPPPAERLEVSTVAPFWEATLALLAELAKRR
jgi:hypothetical protein